MWNEPGKACTILGAFVADMRNGTRMQNHSLRQSEAYGAEEAWNRVRKTLGHIFRVQRRHMQTLSVPKSRWFALGLQLPPEKVAWGVQPPSEDMVGALGLFHKRDWNPRPHQTPQANCNLFWCEARHV